MWTFASEFVQKSLTGVRPDDPEAIPLNFDTITIRGVSGNTFVLFCEKNQLPSQLTPHLLGGHPVDKQDQAAYWRSLWGPSA